MKTRIFYVLISMFFIVSQSGFAEKFSGQSGSELGSNQISFIDETGFFNDNYKYLPYLQIGSNRFFKLKASKASAGLDFFIPLWQAAFSDHLIFTHLRIYDRTGKALEGNAHFGYRYLESDKDHMYGIYGAYDRKRTEFGNYFNQLTVGVEGWFQGFFVGGNYYQPIGKTSRLTGIERTDHVDRVQKSVWVTENKKYEKAMSGGDAEFGYEFVRGLVAYVGGYYFKAKGVEKIYGPKARITYDWSLKNGKRLAKIFDKFGLESGIQKDKTRGLTYYVGVNVRIGLLTNKGDVLQGVARHMVDLVRRDAEIIIGSATDTKISQYPLPSDAGSSNNKKVKKNPEVVNSEVTDSPEVVDQKEGGDPDPVNPDPVNPDPVNPKPVDPVPIDPPPVNLSSSSTGAPLGSQGAQTSSVQEEKFGAGFGVEPNAEETKSNKSSLLSYYLSSFMGYFSSLSKRSSKPGEWLAKRGKS